MKSLGLMISISLISTSALASSLPHPLDLTLQNLSKIQAELGSVRARNAKDISMTEEIDKLEKESSRLWVKSFLLPLNASESKLNQLGYRMIQISQPNHLFQLSKLAGAADMKAELVQFKVGRWQELLDATTEQTAAIQSIQSLTDSSNHTAGFSNVAKELVAGPSDSSRLESVKKLAGIATLSLECVEFFKAKYAEFGLVPQKASDGVVDWSTDDLYRVHQIQNISQASPEKFRTLQSSLSVMTAKLWKYPISCISADKAAFMTTQLRIFQQSAK